MYHPPPTKKKALWIKIRNFFLVVIPLGLVGLSIWAVFSLPEFRIKEITVSGNITTPKDDIISAAKQEVLDNRNFLGKILPEDHLFVWGSRDLEKLKEKIPRITSASLERNLDDQTISIKVSERSEHAIWCFVKGDNKDCYWLSDDGVIFSKSPDSEGSLMRAIYDYSGADIKMGERPIGGEELKNILSSFDLASKFNLDVLNVSLSDRNLKEVTMTLKDGRKILFSVLFDPSSSEKIIASLVNEPEWPILDYLDLRVEGKGFYKLKTVEFSKPETSASSTSSQ